MSTNFKIAFLLFTLTACSREEGCFQDFGDETTTTLNFQNIETITLESGFEVEFGYNLTESITITSGDVYAKNIEVTLENNNTLIFSDRNKCKFIKGYNLAKIKIVSPYLNRIDNRGSGSNIRSIGTWITNPLRISSTGHSSIWEIALENSQFQVISNDISTFNISGKVDLLDLQFASSDSRFNGQFFTSKTAKINHNGTNDVVITVGEKLLGTISNTGNIIYFGEPSSIDVSILGRGNLIKK